MFELLTAYRDKPTVVFTTYPASVTSGMINFAPDTRLMLDGVVVASYPGGTGIKVVNVTLTGNKTYHLVNPPRSVVIRHQMLREIVSWGHRNNPHIQSFIFGQWDDLTNSSRNLISVPSYLPKNVTSLNAMFVNCTSFNDMSVKSWDVSKVTNLWDTFYGCTVFNQNLNDWNVSNVNRAHSTFNGCVAYNQPMNKWNLSKVQYFYPSNGWMTGFLKGATSFNQDLSSWRFPLIPSKPSSFDENTPAWVKTNRQPLWGVS